MEARSALVIGNSDGIGLALTQRLLSADFRVVGVSRRGASLEHARYRHAICDVNDPAYADTLRQLVREQGPFSVCVYCAGIGTTIDFADLAGESLVFRTNLLGLVETTSVLLPSMLAAGRGHFVGLSSIGDRALSAETPSYAASKAGMSSYLAGLALALRPRGIAVSNVRLGFVDTKMAKSPVRPLMITVERAVDVLMRCLADKPARLTHPWAMDVLVRALRCLALLKLAWPGSWRATPRASEDVRP
jgi:NAD(P)-dependent dehydrogenase (short-subunit alcohol dehydrogenase family)